MSKRLNLRGSLENWDEQVRSVASILKAPDREAFLASAVRVIKSDLKKALSGLGPIFSEDYVLAWCLEIIREDFDADGPQTEIRKSELDQEFEDYFDSLKGRPTSG
ncbi:MAG: hypothetical protein BGP06_12200 [Rhizobiales bacterium 65-9]|nr:MAG: hypothetical protein BGP06_12200 [Rhizobiales bacterium 65-9]